MYRWLTISLTGTPKTIFKIDGKSEKKRLSEDLSIDDQYFLLQLMSSLITRDFEHIVRTCKLESWKEALAMALTYARADEFANLCGESCLNVAHICICST